MRKKLPALPPPDTKPNSLLCLHMPARRQGWGPAGDNARPSGICREGGEQLNRPAIPTPLPRFPASALSVQFLWQASLRRYRRGRCFLVDFFPPLFTPFTWGRLFHSPPPLRPLPFQCYRRSFFFATGREEAGKFPVPLRGTVAGGGVETARWRLPRRRRRRRFLPHHTR